MTNSDQPSQMRFPPRSRKILIATLVIAAIGFLDSIYLTAEHFLGVIPPCTVLDGCEQVLSSSYAVIFGVPLALIGALFYIAAFTLVFTYLETGIRSLCAAFAGLSIIGFIASLYFLYLQIFVLGALCLYCFLSAITVTILAVIGATLFFMSRNAL